MAYYPPPEDEQIFAGDEFPFHPSLLKPHDGEENYDDGPYLCALCGRRIGNIDTCVWVEIVEWGVVREQDGRNFSDTEEDGYLGMWPVGKKCAQRLHPTVRAKLV